MPKQILQCSVFYLFDEENNSVLLGYKKRGFGKNQFNGYGGKFDASVDKTIRDTAIRELEEESGIRVQNLWCCGMIEFEFDEHVEAKILQVFVYKSNDGKNYQGTLVETDEMRPAWYKLQDIPYENMWKDDTYWFPHLFEHKQTDLPTIFKAYFRFSDFSTILHHKMETKFVPEQALLDYI